MLIQNHRPTNSSEIDFTRCTPSGPIPFITEPADTAGSTPVSGCPSDPVLGVINAETGCAGPGTPT
jgi:hypothetical protein